MKVEFETETTLHPKKGPAFAVKKARSGPKPGASVRGCQCPESRRLATRAGRMPNRSQHPSARRAGCQCCSARDMLPSRGGTFLTCPMRPQAQQDAILLPHVKAQQVPCRTGCAGCPQRTSGDGAWAAPNPENSRWNTAERQCQATGGSPATGSVVSSASPGGTGTTAASESLSSSRMIRTPCVFRPIALISRTFTRWILPRAVIIST